MTGKRILRRQKIKEITKEKENKRHQNQKNEVFKRKIKNKDNKRKRKYGRLASWFYFGGGWGPTFGFFKSLNNDMVYTLSIYVYI